MNKFVLLAVVCLLGTAAADTRFRRDILPGDARYMARNSGYAYNQPQHHHQASQQPSRYLLPSQETKQPVVIQNVRPSGYTQVKTAPSYQVEQVRSVEQHQHHETYHQPAPMYGPPAPMYGPPPASVVVDVVKSAPVVPHRTYGPPPAASAPVIKTAPVVPHRNYGPPPTKPHQTYGPPPQYPAPMAAIVPSIPVQSIQRKPLFVPQPQAPAQATAHAEAKAQAEAHADAHAEAHADAHAESHAEAHTELKHELPHTGYGVPFRTYETPVQQTQQTFEAPVHETYEKPQVHHQTLEIHHTYEQPAPQVHHIHVHHEQQHHYVEDRAPVQTQVIREPSQYYIPTPTQVESESVNVESQEATQPIGENGGYVY